MKTSSSSVYFSVAAVAADRRYWITSKLHPRFNNNDFSWIFYYKLVFSGIHCLQTSLRLKGPRAKRRAECTEQVAQFYEKLLAQPQLLERYNVTLAELEQAQAMVVAFEAAQLTQTKKKGEARQKLRKWVNSCKKICPGSPGK